MTSKGDSATNPAPSVRSIFCINSGRAGSAYLASILREAENAEAFHEPEPRCTHELFHEFQRGNSGPLKAVLRPKYAQMKDTARAGKIYCETTTMFIKDFGWLLAEEWNPSELGIIVLRRDVEAIVESCLRLDATPLTHGASWMLSPFFKDRVTHPPRLAFLGVPASFRMARIAKWLAHFWNGPVRRRRPIEARFPRWLQNYERGLVEWQVRETYAQGERFQAAYPEARYFEVTLPELNDIAKVEELFRFFGLRPGPGLPGVVGHKKNEKSRQKRRN